VSKTAKKDWVKQSERDVRPDGVTGTPIKRGV
jgi:hypothetical protein